MKLIDADPKKQHIIDNFGNISKKDILNFYVEGVVEGEIVTIIDDIKKSKKIIILKIDNNVISFNSKFAKEIEVSLYEQ